VDGRTDVNLILYLVALLLPTPMLILGSYMLRYRIRTTQRNAKGSTKSTSTHRSLALMSEAELSIPAVISPKLTPVEKRVSIAPARMTNLLEPKPSVTNFGYNRRHTVHEATDLHDIDQEEAMRRTLARRSGDVWIESGHAVEGGGILSRAAEMIKPTPAMRVLDSHPRPSSLLNRLRGGVVSMLPEGLSYDNFARHHLEDGGDQNSPIQIQIISPSKSENRPSTAISMVSEDTGMDMSANAEIVTAKKGRISASPSFTFGRRDSGASEDRYDVDWLTAGVLPR